MSDHTAERMALNDAAFRAANEQIVTTADGFGMSGRLPFVCECADPGCSDVILIDRDTYARVRENPRWFFNLPGHQALSVQVGVVEVVEDNGDFLVVEKLGEAARIAEETANVQDLHEVE